MTDPCGSYRLGEVLYDFFRYIGYNKLYTYPGHIQCDDYLIRALGVTEISVEDAPGILLAQLIKVQSVSLTGGALEALKVELEQDLIASIIKKQNNL